VRLPVWVLRDKSAKSVENQRPLAERVGFEPTVQLPVQRFSSSMILVLECVASNRWLETTCVSVDVSAYDKDFDASHRTFFVGRIVDRYDIERLSREEGVGDPMNLTI